MLIARTNNPEEASLRSDNRLLKTKVLPIALTILKSHQTDWLGSTYQITHFDAPPPFTPRESLQNAKQARVLASGLLKFWSRGADLNHRPSGYEPDELTRLLHPAMYVRHLFTMGKAARKNITLVGRTRQELNLASQNHHMQISATLPQPFSNYFVSPQVGSI